MKKNITIIILVLVSAFFVIYGYIKASEVEKYSMQVEAAYQEGKRLRDEAVKLQQNALSAAAKARMAEAEAIDLAEKLHKCQSK